MKWFRKYMAGALLLVLVLTAACGNSNDNVTDKPNDNTTNNGTTVEEDMNTTVDDAGNTVEDLGDDVVNGVDDVVDGAEDVVDDMTGTGGTDEGGTTNNTTKK